MRQWGWMALLAGSVVSTVACGGSSDSSAPTAPPTPDTAVAIGTTLSVTSGETGQPIAGAHLVVSGRPYDTDAGGKVTLSDPYPYGSLVDVTAPGFLDRQTLLRKGGDRRIVLWPGTTPWGLTKDYTAQLVYTYGSSDPPPLGSSPLQRIKRGTTQVVVVISDEIRQGQYSNQDHQIAVANINSALAGRLTYVLAPTRPASGVIFDSTIDPSDPICGDRVLGYALMSYEAGEIVGGKLVYCSLRTVTTGTIAHELGHTAGLNHSAISNDLMYQYANGIEQFSPAERLSLGMLFERAGGNLFPDNDRTVSTAGSSTRTIVCY